VLLDGVDYASVLGISRSTAYYECKPIYPEDLEKMRLIERLLQYAHQSLFFAFIVQRIGSTPYQE